MEENPNPYASPQSNLEREDTTIVGAQPGKGRFDIGECLSDAWRNTIENIGPILGAMALVVAGYVLIYGVGVGAMFVSLPLGIVVLLAGIFLLAPAAGWGLTRFALDVHDGRCDFNTIFVGFKNYGRSITRMGVVALLFLVIYLVGAIPQYLGLWIDNTPLYFIGAIFALGWNLLLMVRFYWAPMYVVDRDLSGREAFAASWRDTSGQWLLMIALSVLSFAITVLGMLACGVGLFLAMPISYLIYVSAYRQTVGSPGAPAASEATFE